jgi:hypothetical protein
MKFKIQNIRAINLSEIEKATKGEFDDHLEELTFYNEDYEKMIDEQLVEDEIDWVKNRFEDIEEYGGDDKEIETLLLLHAFFEELYDFMKRNKITHIINDKI